MVRRCVGCGFCCRKAPCSLSVYVHGVTSPSQVCKSLVWDSRRRRYWCGLCWMPDRQERKTLNWVQLEMRRNMAKMYRKRLYIGEGCCCPMNTDRGDIPPPGEKNECRTGKTSTAGRSAGKTCQQDPYLGGVRP